jgi:hypothetical protein
MELLRYGEMLESLVSQLVSFPILGPKMRHYNIMLQRFSRHDGNMSQDARTLRIPYPALLTGHRANILGECSVLDRNNHIVKVLISPP